MRCLFICHTFPQSGNSLRAAAFAKLFRQAGHIVTVMSVSPMRRFRSEETLTHQGYEIHTPHYIPFGLLDPQEGWSPFSLARRISHLVVTDSYDLVYCFGHKPDTLLPSIWARQIGYVPVIYDWCDYWGGPDGNLRGFVEKVEAFRRLPIPLQLFRKAVFRFEDWIERKALGIFDGVTVISQPLRQSARDLGVHPLFLERILTPVDTANVRPRSTAEARADMKPGSKAAPPADFFKAGVPVFGVAANVMLDGDIFWERLAAYATAHAEPHFLLIGPGFKEAPKSFRQSPLKERIHMTGHVPSERVEPYLSACDVLWCPLEPTWYNEARFPQKVFDYLALGRPLVVADVGDAPAMVRKGNAGYVYAAGADFDEAFAPVLAARGDWAEWGRGARAVAESEFSHPVIQRKFNLLLMRLFGDRTTRGGGAYRI